MVADTLPESLAIPLPVGVDGGFIGIYMYVAPDGTIPAYDFLESLDRRGFGRYISMLQKYVVSNGQARGGYHHSLRRDRSRANWTGTLAYFRDISGQTRLFDWPGGKGRLILGHGFGGKKENKLDDTEVARAAAMKNDYDARLAGLGQATVGAGGRRKRGRR